MDRLVMSMVIVFLAVVVVALERKKVVFILSPGRITLSALYLGSAIGMNLISVEFPISLIKGVIVTVLYCTSMIVLVGEPRRFTGIIVVGGLLVIVGGVQVGFDLGLLSWSVGMTAATAGTFMVTEGLSPKSAAQFSGKGGSG